ncbi:uncharacterized protein LOC130977851 [Arachis stenosperma]|uniref:uncharacterized protein LOC130977851 n=1 Tax=Arachis stenosperma TaxID=217475 RepID=UPI0025ACCFD9|nr:uncharacterized protein LOC130977851 [Arachis stenosperma]
MTELDADGQGRDNSSNLFVRFLGQVAHRIIFCPIFIKRWDKMPEDNTKRQWKLIEENFEFDYAASVKWALKTLGDRWKAHKYNLRGEYFFLNKRKAEILAANPSDIPPVEWTAFVDHYMDPKTKEKKLGRPVCRSEVIVSTLLKKDRRKLAEHLSEDQEHVATEGIHSEELAHPDDAIGKVCGPENGKRVRGFSNAACPSGFGFGKSKHIFGGENTKVLAVHCNSMLQI